MKTYLQIIGLVFFIARSALGDVWVVPSEIVPKTKNDSLMQRQRDNFHDSDFDSFFDLQLSHPIDAKTLSDFLESETQAQRAEVNGDFLDALEKYSRLVNGLLDVPNTSGVQKITFSAMVHRAHLADILRLPLAEKLWQDAHAYNPTADMSKEEFSPDLSRRFLKLPAAGTFELILSANPMAILFADGLALKSTDGVVHVQLEFGTHQLCALAAGSEWSCKKLAFSGPSHYVKLALDSNPMISGTCEQPEFHGGALPHSVKLIVDFARDRCQRVYYDRTWFSISGQRMESLNLAPSVTVTNVPPFSEPTKKNWFHELTNSGWFWTGVGAVLVGALVISAQNQPATVIPSQSYR